MKRPFFILALGLLATAPHPASATDQLPNQGSVLAAPCASCHGSDGSGAGAIPALKGRPASVLLDQLKAFRSGALPSTVMGRLAKGYSDDQLSQLAAHFGDK
ncbi:c-type cytochrome [Magnetospirillum gryphiswaldense]|uniref:c-type cytochrome n=1 Tax=Magnetospirillum gryphiswaldense TaxID=55518 RepID=UPI000D02FE17|nr:c-type cytochrome [Magnetospirillum gryphiswaldense]AVM73498.1 Cytochrome subunit of sulfide dehydrogenase [Magnetospirillum gryphiswaldense MSR-1]AVM77401.1 Cytochrome subunit of sulfide dehydrogenase [Magnetospirillum gryphiswaldense]